MVGRFYKERACQILKKKVITKVFIVHNDYTILLICELKFRLKLPCLARITYSTRLFTDASARDMTSNNVDSAAYMLAGLRSPTASRALRKAALLRWRIFCMAQ